MPDWNKDGKIDWYDDFLFEKVVKTDNSYSYKAPSSSTGSSILNALGSLLKIFTFVLAVIFGIFCLYCGLWLASTLSDIFL